MTVLSVIFLASALVISCNGKNLLECTHGQLQDEYIADDIDLCLYYRCTDGQPSLQWPGTCKPGYRLPAYYNISNRNPCSEKTSSRIGCLRCDLPIDSVPADGGADYCTSWSPCQSQCLCHDRGAGFWCDCPTQPVASNIQPNEGSKCKIPGFCFNGGSCYELYDNEVLCMCMPGWTGRQCENQAALCNWNSCQLYGTCLLKASQIVCQCDTCGNGSYCESYLSALTNCSEYFQVDNCSSVGPHLCQCNPCPQMDDICIDGTLGSTERKCIRLPNTSSHTYTVMFQKQEGGTNQFLSVYVSAAYDDNITRVVTVDAPLGTPDCSYSETANISSGAVHRFLVNSCLIHGGTGKGNYGIRIREINKNLLNVYCLNQEGGSDDGWLALPDNVAGKTFVILPYKPKYNSSQFAIVAIESQTEISIRLLTAVADIPNSAQNTEYQVHLDAWQTYQVISPNNDLSGTTISSNKPIHVYSGNALEYVGPGKDNPNFLKRDTVYHSKDYLTMECSSVDTWGNAYAIVPLPRAKFGYNYSEEILKIAGINDTTCLLQETRSNSQFRHRAIILTRDNSFLSESYMNADSNFFLACSNPIMMVEITESSFGLYRMLNDPSFIFVPTISAYANFYYFFPPNMMPENKAFSWTFLRLIFSGDSYNELQINSQPPDTNSAPIKPWSKITAPQNYENYGNVYGAIFIISNTSPSKVTHSDLRVTFCCIVEGCANYRGYGIALGFNVKFTDNATTTKLADPEIPISTAR